MYTCQHLKLDPNKLYYFQGKQGDKILVQGINTGVAWVKARLAHPAYKVRSDT